MWIISLVENHLKIRSLLDLDLTIVIYYHRLIMEKLDLLRHLYWGALFVCDLLDQELLA